MSGVVSSLENHPLLTVTDLGKSYGDSFALKNISLDVRPNEIVGLIGPNGAGKTTLLECIAGLLPFNKGTFAW